MVRADQGGAVVAEWLDLLAPAVLEAYEEESWPKTLVLNSTWFRAENPWTHTHELAFSVLGAYGYPARRRSRPAVGAGPTHTAAQSDWEAFLRGLDITAPPKLVITDGTQPHNAVRAVWPATPGPRFPTPFHHPLRAPSAPQRDGTHGQGPHRRVDAPAAQASWLRLPAQRGLDEMVDEADGYQHTEAWLTGIAEIQTQVTRPRRWTSHLAREHLDAPAMSCPPSALGRTPGQARGQTASTGSGHL
jgi:hypothetical protein